MSGFVENHQDILWPEDFELFLRLVKAGYEIQMFKNLAIQSSSRRQHAPNTLKHIFTRLIHTTQISKHSERTY
jgi:hypothetical protein